MYGIGVFEIFLIFLVLLLFFKPAEIFSLFRKFGAWYRKIRRIEEDMRKEWDSVPDESSENFDFDIKNDFDTNNSDRKGEDL